MKKTLAALIVSAFAASAAKRSSSLRQRRY